MVSVLHDDSMHVFLSLVSWYAWYVDPVASKSFSMCTPSSYHSLPCHHLSVYLFLQFTHDETTSNQKPPSLAWCILLMFWVTGRDDNSLWKHRVQLTKVGMRNSRRTTCTVGKNFTMNTGRLSFLVKFTSGNCKVGPWGGHFCIVHVRKRRQGCRGYARTFFTDYESKAGMGYKGTTRNLCTICESSVG